MSLFAWMVRHTLPLMPRRLVWTVARHYVAGDDLRAALVRIESLRQAGFGTILDVLGEAVSSEAGARDASAEYMRALAGLRDVDPDCPISVKPTHLGLLVDQDLCAELLESLCQAAEADDRAVRFEMEDAPTIDSTLEVFEAVASRHAHLGCVLQSRLFRTSADTERLLRLGRSLSARVVKGIYLEPPAIAWQDDEEISRQFVGLVEQLLDGGAQVGLATHDDRLAARCLEVLAARGLGPDSGRYEFQCLMGVRPKFAADLREQGHPVRVYVPYGRDWYAYSMRRLTRNPDIAKHVIRAALGRSR
jgi:proline dehydrogenase